jgi:Amyloid A4 N-terminal heparin-binding
MCYKCVLKVESGYQPMVAFTCNYPAMYLTENGWIKDDETDCVDDVEDVLDYCKKVPKISTSAVFHCNKLQVPLLEIA